MKRNINNKLLRIVKFLTYKYILINSLLSVIFLHRRILPFPTFSYNQKSNKITHFRGFLYQYARETIHGEFSDIVGNTAISLINRQIIGILRPFYHADNPNRTLFIGGKISTLTRTQTNQKVFSYLTALKGAVLPVRLPFGKRIGSTRTVPFRLLGLKPKYE